MREGRATAAGDGGGRADRSLSSSYWVALSHRHWERGVHAPAALRDRVAAVTRGPAHWWRSAAPGRGGAD